MSDVAGAELENTLTTGYQPLGGVRDEMIDASGAVTPHWRSFLASLSNLSRNEIESRFEQLTNRMRAAGASYRVYNAPGGGDRPWPISHIPLMMGAAEWRQIAEGVVQRARLQEALLADVYGPQTLVRDGALPPAVIAGSPEFLRPLVGVTPRGGKFLRLYAADLGRGPDGRWWVMADRVQAPSGAGYALENRLAMAAAFSEAFGTLEVERLAGFFQAHRESLTALSQTGGVGPCVLTPGPMNETYFEHAYLARYLGFLLVEGEDLTVREDQVFVRTVAGLRKAEVLVRRLDSDFADPLELNAHSHIGTPGLTRAVRGGHVTLANALGVGISESRALLGFTPALAQRLLGEDLLLPNVATWWCGQKAAREEVLDRLDQMAIAPAFSSASGTYAQVRLGADMTPAEKEKLIAQLRRRGVDHVGQEVVSLSTMPVWSQGRLRPRPFQVRVFAAATENGWVVMPGGFCRVAAAPDARAISMQLGGMSADVWVVGDGAAPSPKPTLLPTPANIEIKRHFGALTARAADNLFWFGRYLERTETVVRLVRAGHVRASLRDRGERGVGRNIARLLADEDAIPAETTALTRKVALAALTDLRNMGSAAANAASARRTALNVRERFSVDVASAVDELAAALDLSVKAQTDPIERADRAVRLCASVAGYVQENMVQLTGWRFLEIGRRLERALNTARAVEALGLGDAPVSSLEALLELGDSSITYAQRYFVAAAQRPVIDLLVLDDSNPRSCAFQIRTLRDLVHHLPGESTDETSSPARRIAERLTGEVAGADAKSVDAPFLERLSGQLCDLSDALSQRYLVNRERLAFSFRVDE
jgi:uncharacterized circularly permuted ATP-grasp superfamily protein/uncharacterized alpha-E superfamily protein